MKVQQLTEKKKKKKHLADAFLHSCHADNHFFHSRLIVQSCQGESIWGREVIFKCLLLQQQQSLQNTLVAAKQTWH